MFFGGLTTEFPSLNEDVYCPGTCNGQHEFKKIESRKNAVERTVRIRMKESHVTSCGILLVEIGVERPKPPRIGVFNEIDRVVVPVWMNWNVEGDESNGEGEKDKNCPRLPLGRKE